MIFVVRPRLRGLLQSAALGYYRNIAEFGPRTAYTQTRIRRENKVTPRTMSTGKGNSRKNSVRFKQVSRIDFSWGVFVSGMR